ncbi:MAG TPA: SNF2-related protein, partial [Flavobacteriaceae bacterium]|nr:SNF2-related protein [Flavobacteriaceae bacterium]
MQILQYPNEFHIHIPFNNWRNRNLEGVKKLTIRKFDYAKKVWVVPSYLEAEVQRLSENHYAKIVKVENTKPQEVGEIEPLPDLDFEIKLSHPQGFDMREYQKKGVARGMQLKRFINGDEQGLGKTLQSISTLYAAKERGENPFPALIICPASMKNTWQREWTQWTGIKSMILDDKNKNTWHRFHEMGMVDVFITNYESLKKFFVLDMPPKGKLRNSMDIKMKPTVDVFKSVIIDE